MIQIETGIAPPQFRRGPPERYPWAALEPFQSFFVPGGSPHSLSLSCKRASKRYGREFRCAAARSEDGALGVRVWRLA